MGGSAVSAQGRLGTTGSARSVKADPRENGAPDEVRGRPRGRRPSAQALPVFVGVAHVPHQVAVCVCLRDGRPCSPPLCNGREGPTPPTARPAPSPPLQRPVPG